MSQYLIQGNRLTFYSPHIQNQRCLEKKHINDNLIASLDVAKISDRSASLILLHKISNLRKHSDDCNVSYSTIQRVSKKRKSITKGKKEKLRTDKHLIIHWDDKRLKDFTGNVLVDRLPVFVSGNGEDQLLSVPKLNH